VVRDPYAWVDRRSYRVRFDRLRRLVPEVAMDRSVKSSLGEIAAYYRKIGLNAEMVRDLRFTRLEQLRLGRERGIIDADLRRRFSGVAASRSA
ncbi:MAG: hypothetical protein K5799_15185, partial [Erythrobacter sp.]|nr:hypothetical protein [Erythrobacter sp.]